MTALVAVAPNFPGFYYSALNTMLDSAEENLCEWLATEHPDFAPYTPSEIAEAITQTTTYRAAFEHVTRDYAEAFARHLDAASGRALGIEYESMDSPREYNFTTDRCYVLLPMASAQHMLDATRSTTLGETIKSQFTARDGYIPFYSSDLEAWLEKPLAEWDHNEAGTLLRAYVDALEVGAIYDDVVGDLYEASTGSEAIDRCIDRNAVLARLQQEHSHAAS